MTTSTVIEIKFPSTFTFAGSDFHYIVSGLTDISAASPAGCYANNTDKTLTLSNFAAQATPGTITVRTRVTNPSTAGVTSAIQIKTYTDYTKTKIVD